MWLAKLIFFRFSWAESYAKLWALLDSAKCHQMGRMGQHQGSVFLIIWKMPINWKYELCVYFRVTIWSLSKWVDGCLREARADSNFPWTAVVCSCRIHFCAIGINTFSPD
jgi:hypothetical protein